MTTNGSGDVRVAAVRHELDRLRSRLLAGRGPGAGSDELADHQRERALLGALPCATERAIVAVQTAAVRGAEPGRLRAAIRRIRRTLS